MAETVYLQAHVDITVAIEGTDYAHAFHVGILELPSQRCEEGGYNVPTATLTKQLAEALREAATDLETKDEDDDD